MNKSVLKAKYADAEEAPMDGNTAAAHVTYLASEAMLIYPITPSSPMGELADEWSAEGRKNIHGVIPEVYEMQSEAGASGAVHGALTAGAQTATFTASQGLLLMIPNMYKIASELTPAIFQVSARSVSCQALSIFGDHSDVMAVRQTGFGLVCAANPQEVMDLTAVSIRTSQKSRIPFVHFFDGFRTSHEIRKIKVLSEEFMKEYLDFEDWIKSRKNALDPLNPTLRGTAQNPDIYFQGRETVNPYYEKVRTIFPESCKLFEQMTGRKYEAYEYVGPDAPENIIVIMGSGADTAEETVRAMMKKGDSSCGLVKVRLYRPFFGDLFLQAVPESVRRIAVLDRTKEPGGIGEPLYLDVNGAYSQAVMEIEGLPKIESMPLIIGGRYGLSSKNFTPGMVKGVFDHLSNLAGSKKVWTGFTVGINDDVSRTSIPYSGFDTENEDCFRGKFYGLGADGTVGANKNSIKIIGDYTDNYCQGYFVYDSKKSGARTVSHLRFSKDPIRSTYLISKPNFVAVHNESFLTRFDVLEGIEEGGTFLLNTRASRDEVFGTLPGHIQQTIIDKKLRFYIIDGTAVSEEVGLRGRINIAMQAAFFKISAILPEDTFRKAIADSIEKTYGSKGEKVVRSNVRAMELALDRIFEVEVPPAPVSEGPPLFKVNRELLGADARFVENVIEPVMADKGDDIPVSAIPVNGAIPTGSSVLEKRSIAIQLPEWNPELCIQCNRCSFICPHATIRPKLIKKSDLDKLSSEEKELFKVIPARGYKSGEELYFRIQSYPEDCTGCGACATICPGEERDPKTKEKTGNKALMMKPIEELRDEMIKTCDVFMKLPDTPKELLNIERMKDAQFLKPLFEFSGACAGCGETPYVKLITQLYGDKLYIANATGCSSIYGGTMPVVPYTKNERGEGPAWQSSLFEDNAEFGFGIAYASKKLHRLAVEALQGLAGKAKDSALNEILLAGADEQKKNEFVSYETVQKLKSALARAIRADGDTCALSNLESLATHLMKKIVFAVGGDGWAYDIGYGGLDHVLASGLDMNILVLDTGVYSNTGGQKSKATPMGAVAKFAAGGKSVPRKDIGLMAMGYKSVYVAQVSYGANPAQTQKAFQEAVSFPGTSLIIAYSPCIEHGYALDRAPIHCKLAVDCGFWPIYRYDPRRSNEGKNPLQLDSKEIKASYRDFARMENRFRRLMMSKPEEAEALAEKADRIIKENFEFYKKLAEM